MLPSCAHRSSVPRCRHLPGFTCNRISSYGSCRVTALSDTGVGLGCVPESKSSSPARPCCSGSQEGCMALSAWQEQPGSRLMGRPQQVERAGEAIGRPEMPGPTRLVQVHPLLAEIVDQIADWDFPDGGVARALKDQSITEHRRLPYRAISCPNGDGSS